MNEPYTCHMVNIGCSRVAILSTYAEYIPRHRSVPQFFYVVPIVLLLGKCLEPSGKAKSEIDFSTQETLRSGH